MQDLACESRSQVLVSVNIGRTRFCPEPELPTSLRSIALDFGSFLEWYGAAEATKMPSTVGDQVQADNRKGIRTLKP